MFAMYDRVLDKKTGKPCFVIDIDDNSGEALPGEEVYGLEAEDQTDPDWFRWADFHDLEKLPEHDPVPGFWDEV